MSSSNKIKGHAARVIQPPGYHIHPKYDLVHTRHLLEERRAHKKSFALNLAPMVDMFSVLVIFLLMNFSSTGEVFFMGKDIKIPQAKKGLPMQSFPLLSVVKDKVMFEVPDTGKGNYVEEANDGKNERLRQELRRIKDLEEQIGGKGSFRGQINVQADERTEAEAVKRVMRVLMEEGWTIINFIIEPKDAG